MKLTKKMLHLAWIVLVVVALAWIAMVLFGCQTIPPSSHDVEEAEVLQAQMNTQKSMIDGLQWHINDLRQSLTTGMSDEQRLEVESQIAALQLKIDEFQTENSHLAGQIDTLLSPDTTAPEWLGTALSAGGGVLGGWPGIILGLIGGAIGGGAHQRKRGNNQFSNLVNSVELARVNETTVDWSRVGQLQDKLGIRRKVRELTS